MTTRPVSSTLQAWELGVRLRHVRSLLGLTATSVAKSVGIAPSNFSAIEAGKRRITTRKLTELAEIYQLAEPEQDLLQTLRNNAEQHNWWHDYGELYSEEFLRFLGMEAGASSVREWAPSLIPGLLQTSDYARATIRAGSPYIRAVDVGPRLETRLARQMLLDNEPKLRFDALLGEGALRQRMGDPATMRHQFDHLIHLAEQSDSAVTVRVVPFDSAHPLIGAPLSLLSFATPLLPDLVWQETAITGNLIDKRQVIRESEASFTEVFESIALSDIQSIEVIRQIRHEMEAT
jgi:transcriptional regulator with XRE-family HTH domain